MIIKKYETERLILRQWQESDIAPFAEMNSPQDGICNPVLTFSSNLNKGMNMWTGMTIGKKLLDECEKKAKNIGAKKKKVCQILVVCGDHDMQKFSLLETINMKVASRWYTRKTT